MTGTTSVEQSSKKRLVALLLCIFLDGQVFIVFTLTR